MFDRFAHLENFVGPIVVVELVIVSRELAPTANRYFDGQIALEDIRSQKLCWPGAPGMSCWW